MVLCNQDENKNCCYKFWKQWGVLFILIKKIGVRLWSYFDLNQKIGEIWIVTVIAAVSSGLFCPGVG